MRVMRLVAWGIVIAMSAASIAAEPRSGPPAKAKPPSAVKRAPRLAPGVMPSAEAIFKRIDRNGDGKITLDEFRQAHRRLLAMRGRAGATFAGPAGGPPWLRAGRVGPAAGMLHRRHGLRPWGPPRRLGRGTALGAPGWRQRLRARMAIRRFGRSHKFHRGRHWRRPAFGRRFGPPGFGRHGLRRHALARCPMWRRRGPAAFGPPAYGPKLRRVPWQKPGPHGGPKRQHMRHGPPLKKPPAARGPHGGPPHKPQPKAKPHHRGRRGEKSAD